MASTSGFAETVERSVTCPICFEFFVDPHVPKDLECPHTCCQVCLQNIVTLNPDQPITCPMRCAKKTSVPVGGVKNLRTNLNIRNLAEVHPNYANGAKPIVPKCDKHNENLHLYCSHCNTLACHNCVIVYHTGTQHVITDVEDMTKQRKEELKTVAADTDKEIKSCQKLTAELKKLEAKVLNGAIVEKRKISRSGNDLIKVVKKNIRRLESEVQNASDAKLNEIQTEISRLENQTSTLQAACNVAKQTGESSDHAYITQHAELMEKMKKELTSVKEKDPPQVKLNPGRAWFVKTATTCSAEFGKVVELRQEFGKFESATHVASSKDGLLAVSDLKNGKKVTICLKENEVYKKKGFLELNITNTNRLEGVVFVSDDKLWVARQTVIEVYSSTGKFEKTISTKVNASGIASGPASGVCSLAITADGSRILASDSVRNVITVHDPAGTIIKTLKTSIRPCRITVIQNSHVAVSNWQPGKLIVMNMITGAETLNIGIDMLSALCYDKYSDCVFTGRREEMALVMV
ncbi:tripartite motif containing 13-like [Amphiura filiformis]|uniref:tripartite motif containing 13-like n=1 Tax=Amphiura filiformis TaxID=82378 RepID=UPI003B20D41F